MCYHQRYTYYYVYHDTLYRKGAITQKNVARYGRYFAKYNYFRHIPPNVYNTDPSNCFIYNLSCKVQLAEKFVNRHFMWFWIWYIMHHHFPVEETGTNCPVSVTWLYGGQFNYHARGQDLCLNYNRSYRWFTLAIHFVTRSTQHLYRAALALINQVIIYECTLYNIT